MTFDNAAKYEMKFGKYKGQTLDDIAKTDEGLKYLDWLRGEKEGEESVCAIALNAYLDDPAIQRELENI